MHLKTLVLLLVFGLILVLGRPSKPQGLEVQTDQADPFEGGSDDAFQLIEEVLEVSAFLFPHEVDILNALKQLPGGFPILRIASGVLKEKRESKLERRIPRLGITNAAFMNKLILFLDLIDGFNLALEDLSIASAALLESLVTGYTLTLQIDEQIVPINKQDLLDALFAIITETLPSYVPGNALFYSPQLQLETIINAAEINDNGMALSYKEALLAALFSLSTGNTPIIGNIIAVLKEKQSQFEFIIADPFNNAVSQSAVDNWFQLLDEGFAGYKHSEAFVFTPGAGFILDIIKDTLQRKKTSLASREPETAIDMLQHKSALLKALIEEFALPAANHTTIDAFIGKLAFQKLAFLETLIEGVILSTANSPNHIVFDGVLSNRKVYLHALFALVTGESATRADRKLLKIRSRLVALIAKAAASDGDPALNYKEALFVALVALFDDDDGILTSEGYIGFLLEPKKSLFTTVLERFGGALLGTLTVPGGMSGVTVLPDGAGSVVENLTTEVTSGV